MPDAIRLDPWTHIKAVHWRDPREAVYLVSSAVFSQFHPVTLETEEVSISDGTPPPPPNYNNLWITFLECSCLVSSRFYTDCALYDENAQFFGHATQQEFSIATPAATQTMSFGQLEVMRSSQEHRFDAHSEGSENTLFPGYIDGPAALISKGWIYGAGNGVFDTDIPDDNLGRLCKEVASTDAEIATFDVTPGSATYRGRSYTPIAARYFDSEQAVPGFTYGATGVSVLFQRN